MKFKFPWYKTMHALLHGSPVYDTSALANSATPLDTSVLTTQKDVIRQSSPDWDHAALDASFVDVHNKSESQPGLDDDIYASSGSVMEMVAHTGPVAASPISKSSSSSSLDPPSSMSRKRKDPFQQVQELTTVYTKSHLESERL